MQASTVGKILISALLIAGVAVGIYFLATGRSVSSEVQKREEKRLADFVATNQPDKQCDETLAAGKTEASAATHALCCAKEYHYADQVLGKSFADYTDDLMSAKVYGTCKKEVFAADMRWDVPIGTVTDICCFNRHLAEFKYSWEKIADFWDELEKVRGTDGMDDENPKNTMTFYDSITQLPLYVAPIDRSWREFIDESKLHGWPSFRDQEVIQKNVRILPNHKGELVSIDGTHLGHNLPDGKGNRHCVNLVSAAGKKKEC